MQEEIDRAKMSGDLPAEPTMPDDASASTPAPHYDPRKLRGQRASPKRMAIISAGVIMNLIFAYIVVACCYRAGSLNTNRASSVYVSPGRAGLGKLVLRKWGMRF